MSDFKAKNLTYDKSQPAFLQKLRAEYSGDRSNVQFARPNKSRLKTGDADEDEPTIVDETGEGVSKQEYEEMLKKEKEAGENGTGEVEGKEEGREEVTEEKDHAESGREKQQVAEVGGGRKRKAGKVVRDVEEEEVPKSTVSGATQKSKQGAKEEFSSEQTSKPKKKAKKIKLSFDEPGD